MAKVIDCECGQRIRAETEEELLAKAQQHVRENHPDLVETLSRDDLLGMAHEEG